jgi:uncharacterized protein
MPTRATVLSVVGTVGAPARMRSRDADGPREDSKQKNGPGPPLAVCIDISILRNYTLVRGPISGRDTRQIRSYQVPVQAPAGLAGTFLLEAPRSMSTEHHVERGYRSVIEPKGLLCYPVVVGESDLYVCTRDDRSAEALGSLAEHRAELESYLMAHPDFGTSFRPVPVDSEAPAIVRQMALAAQSFDVGPMASVAGAVAQFVGEDLLAISSEVIVENGGDLFLAGGTERRVRIFSGREAPRLDMIVEGAPGGVGLCTSSATVGPSISLGAAEAVTVLAQTATIADAAATAIGNRVLSAEDLQDGLKAASEGEGVLGAVIIVQGSMGAWGKLELAPAG